MAPACSSEVVYEEVIVYEKRELTLLSSRPNEAFRDRKEGGRGLAPD